MKQLQTIFFLVLLNISQAQEQYLLVGTYDSPLSEGLYIYRFNSTNGESIPVSHFKTTNPSFLVVSPDEQFVYAVQETSSKDGTGGKLTAFVFHKHTGSVTFLNEQNTWGDNPCHVEMDRTGKWLFVANYSGGNLSVFPVLPDGSIGPASVIKHSGSGPHPRQKTPHVHGNTISTDNKWLITSDLGIDKLVVYPFNGENGKLDTGRKKEVAAAPGSGPRLSTFHPNNNFLYVIEELTGTVSMYKYKSGTLKRKQRIGSMTSGDTTFAGSAHILVSGDGRFLYASNRGTANNIAVYSIDKKGRLSLLGHHSTLGLTPRNFSIDPTGKYLLVANQNSNEIVVFERDMASGGFTDTGNRVKIGKPVCLKWIKGN